MAGINGQTAQETTARTRAMTALVDVREPDEGWEYTGAEATFAGYELGNVLGGDEVPGGGGVGPPGGGGVVSPLGPPGGGVGVDSKSDSLMSPD